MVIGVVWFVDGGPFFIFSLSPKSTAWLFLLLVFQLQFLFFLFLFFILNSFIKVLFVFHFVHQFQFDIFFLQVDSYSFDFLNSFLCLFVKLLLVFNFIIRSKFMVFCFFNLIFFVLISNFFLSWSFCQNLIYFQSHPLIQIYDILFLSI